jgi:hypothetical protein
MSQVKQETIARSLGNFPLRCEGYLIGFKRPEGFEMTEPEAFSVQGNVRRHPHQFDCEIGRLKIGEREYKHTYLVEIDTGKVADEIRERLEERLGFSWGSHSYLDAAEAGMELAKGVLEERGLSVATYISSYPKIIFVCDKAEQSVQGDTARSPFIDLVPPGEGWS